MKKLYMATCMPTYSDGKMESIWEHYNKHFKAKAIVK